MEQFEDPVTSTFEVNWQRYRCRVLDHFDLFNPELTSKTRKCNGNIDYEDEVGCGRDAAFFGATSFEEGGSGEEDVDFGPEDEGRWQWDKKEEKFIYELPVPEV